MNNTRARTMSVTQGAKATKGVMGFASRDEDSGFTLVEMLIAMVIFALFTGMTMTTIILMNGSTLSSVRLGTSAESTQNSFAALERYLENAVSPSQLSNSNLGVESKCGPLSAPFYVLENSKTGTEVLFCSFGIHNESGSPHPYLLDICTNVPQGDNTGSLIVESLPSLSSQKTVPSPQEINKINGTLLVNQSRVICTAPSGSSESYLTFCTSSNVSPPSSGDKPASTCSTPAKGNVNAGTIYLRLSVSSNRPNRTGSAAGFASPTTLSSVLRLVNLEEVS